MEMIGGELMSLLIYCCNSGEHEGIKTESPEGKSSLRDLIHLDFSFSSFCDLVPHPGGTAPIPSDLNPHPTYFLRRFAPGCQVQPHGQPIIQSFNPASFHSGPVHDLRQVAKVGPGTANLSFCWLTLSC